MSIYNDTPGAFATFTLGLEEAIIGSRVKHEYYLVNGVKGREAPLGEVIPLERRDGTVEFRKSVGPIAPRGRDYIDRYETDVAKYAALKGKYDGVICGHIHVGNIRQIGEITYMCCGDFVDQCSAIVEKDGKFDLVSY